MSMSLRELATFRELLRKWEEELTIEDREEIDISHIIEEVSATIVEKVS